MSSQGSEDLGPVSVPATCQGRGRAAGRGAGHSAPCPLGHPGMLRGPQGLIWPSGQQDEYGNHIDNLVLSLAISSTTV